MRVPGMKSLGRSRNLSSVSADQTTPEAVIWSLAYNAYKLPPTDIKRFPDNVGITLCLIPTVVVQNQAGVREKNRALIEQWFDLVNRNPERLIAHKGATSPVGRIVQQLLDQRK